MTPYDPEKQLVFCHVPRTGGNSIWEYCFKPWFGAGAFMSVENYSKSGPNSVIRDHWYSTQGRGVDDWCPDATQFVCFLRDPLERALSCYDHLRDNNAVLHGSRGTYNMADLSLHSYIDCRADEIATDALSGLPDESRCKIEDFVFVGVQSQMQKCTDAMAQLLGKPPKKVGIHNAAKASVAASPEDTAKLKELLVDEYKLYDRAVSYWGKYW